MAVIVTDKDMEELERGHWVNASNMGWKRLRFLSMMDIMALYVLSTRKIQLKMAWFLHWDDFKLSYTLRTGVSTTISIKQLVV